MQGERQMIGIITAIDTELEQFTKRLADKTGIMYAGNTYYVGHLGKHSIVCVSGGVGTVNAAISTRILIDRFDAKSIIFSGVCGGMKSGMNIGDIVIANEYTYHDRDMEWMISEYPKIPNGMFRPNETLLALAHEVIADGIDGKTVHEGKIVTGDRFIVDEGRSRINDIHSPVAVDMETAAAAHACYVSRTPFISIRALSDSDSDRGIGTFEENCNMAAERAADFVFRMIDKYN